MDGQKDGEKVERQREKGNRNLSNWPCNEVWNMWTLLSRSHTQEWHSRSAVVVHILFSLKLQQQIYLTDTLLVVQTSFFYLGFLPLHQFSGISSVVIPSSKLHILISTAVCQKQCPCYCSNLKHQHYLSESFSVKEFIFVKCLRQMKPKGSTLETRKCQFLKRINIRKNKG